MGGRDVSELSHTPLSKAQKKGGTKGSERESGTKTGGETEREGDAGERGKQRSREGEGTAEWGRPGPQTVATPVKTEW